MDSNTTNTNSQPTQSNTQQDQQLTSSEQPINNENNPAPVTPSLPPQSFQPPQEKKKMNKKLKIALCIIIPLVIIIIVVAILFTVVFNNNDKLSCEANYRGSNVSITLYFNDKQLVGYNAINMEYNYEEQQKYAQEIGIQNYLQEFNQNFEDDYEGSCKIDAPRTKFTLIAYPEYEDDNDKNVYEDDNDKNDYEDEFTDVYGNWLTTNGTYFNFEPYGFHWWKDKNDLTDNYYSGDIEISVGDDAIDELGTTYEKVSNITEQSGGRVTLNDIYAIKLFPTYLMSDGVDKTDTLQQNFPAGNEYMLLMFIVIDGDKAQAYNYSSGDTYNLTKDTE